MKEEDENMQSKLDKIPGEVICVFKTNLPD
jgi:hypothetical protein